MNDYFYGWYLKCQSDEHTLAVIPAVHGEDQKRTCSIQIITEDNSWNIPFSFDVFRREKNQIFIGKNRFGKDGICLTIHTPRLSVEGNLIFGTLSPLKYDIMGPFALVPFMECRHSIWSMQHSVCGTVHINDREYTFMNDRGYWEGDRGRSFPSKYLWTQCFLSKGSLMLSVADIPMAGMHFTGIIGNVLWNGKQYRLATYLGARLIQLPDRKIKIIQKNLELDVFLLEEVNHPLKAPVKGTMVRTIHESVSCKAFYRFRKDGHTLFSIETNQASFEQECIFN